MKSGLRIDIRVMPIPSCPHHPNSLAFARVGPILDQNSITLINILFHLDVHTVAESNLNWFYNCHSVDGQFHLGAIASTGYCAGRHQPGRVEFRQRNV